jgi:alpha-glucosidase
MRVYRSFIAIIVLIALSATAHTQQRTDGPHTLGTVMGATWLPNGLRIETNSGGAEQIVALRDDVLRIRISAGRELPEDASWAVAAEKRASSAAVTREDSLEAIGFRTHLLKLAVRRDDLRLTVRDNNGNVLVEDAAPMRFEGSAFRIVERMPDDEHYFGLGDKTGPLDRRGHAYTMWNTDAYRYQESTDPLYKSIPFFMTFRAGRAAGIFLDNTWRSNFDFGKGSPSYYSFGAVAGPVDYYIIFGPSPRHVVEAYAWLTGKPPLPPRWMLGFQQSRYSYTPESRLMEIAERLRADRIPADALYMDIDYQDRNRPFTVNEKTFSDLPEALAKLHKMDFHVVAITDLHIAKAPGYAPYDSGMAGNEFVHRADGSVYVGSVWPGASVFPDFTRAATRAWWGTLYQSFAKMGIDGFWNDMNEPSVFNSPTGTIPLDAVHRIDEPGFCSRTATHAEIHNVYGMENSQATYDGLLKLEPDTRPFVLTRASYAGGQRYAATWTGDNSSTWNHLRMTTPMLESLGLSGFSYSGADVGGFAGTATPDLLTRWIEVAAFQPIDRDHTEKGSGDQEPWVGGAAQENIRRRFIEERYRLMPYLYTLAEESARTGLPMLRPLFLDFPDATRDKHPIDIDPGVGAEFLLGHDLLIAPPPYPEAPDDYTVEFPSAGWYDFWTGKRIQRPAPASDPDSNAPPSAAEQVALAVQADPTLATLPVYVRAGAILPMQPLVQSTDETPQGPLTLRIYAGDDCRGSLYTDDGESLAYERGDFLRVRFTCAATAKGMRITIAKHEGSYIPWWKELRLEIYGWNPPRGAIFEDGRMAHAPIEHGENFVAITVPDSEPGAAIEIQ